ncbi:MAG: hypothetical protein JRJ56_04145 [Deltaproteobacteria bacterium]|nr:hypothetical protein [Deltaproteobacteria bacterium]
MLFSKLKKEYKNTRKLVTKLNAKITKMATPEQILAAGRKLGLVSRSGNLNLAREGDTEAMIDQLIFHGRLAGKSFPAAYLEKIGDDFLPALERELLAAYEEKAFFSLFEVSDNKKRDFLGLSPLLDVPGFELFDVVLGRVADEQWLLAGRFIPFGGRYIHTGVIYAYPQDAKEELLQKLNDEDDEETGSRRRDHPEKYPLYFYQWYQKYGIQLGQR